MGRSWTWSDAQLDELTKLLLDVWDPLGVKDVPGAIKEYGFHARVLAGVLSDGADVDRILQVLREAGLGIREPDDREAAAAIARWYTRAGISRCLGSWGRAMALGSGGWETKSKQAESDDR